MTAMRPDKSRPRKLSHLPPDELAALKSGGQGASDPLGRDPAEREAELLGQALSEDHIRKLAAGDDYRRGKKFKDQFEIIAICAMWLFALGGGAVGITWLLHVLSIWQWLPKDSLLQVQNLLTGGILVSLFADHFRKRLG
ncbi:MAG: hypothetical protein R3E11_01915 [Sphingobium sp.]|nr:hypothetical protein [Sphingomonas sp.]